MGALDDDSVPLVEKEEPRVKPRRWIVIEPLLVLYIGAGFPMMSVISQFMVIKVGESMGIDYNNLSSSSNDSGSCISNHSDESYILREQVQAEAANWNMYKSLAEFVPGAIAPILYGSVADKIGRRMLFILPCIGSIISVSVYMAIIWFDLPIYFILLSNLEYFFGGMSVMFAGAFAYISDTVPPKHRALRMTIIDAVSMGNGAIANLFVGYWIRAQGFFWPLVFVVCGKFLCLLYAIFLIPESLKKDESNPASRSLQLHDFVTALRVSLHDNGSGRRWKINMLLCSYAVAEIISTRGVTTMYMMNVPLCWESVKLGYYTFIHMMILCITMVIASAVPVRLITAEWKVVISKISSILGSVYMAIAMTSLMMYFAPLVSSLSFLGIPMTRYLFSNLVGPDEQSSMFTLMSVVMHVTSLGSSMASNQIYERTLTILHGSIIFFVAAGCGLISLIIMLAYILLLRREQCAKIMNESRTPVGSINA